jgi:hypothetical protein
MQTISRLSGQALWRSGSMARGQVLLQKERSKLDADGIGIILECARSAAAETSGLTSTVFWISSR